MVVFDTRSDKKIKALECPQDYTSIFRRPMTDNAVVSGEILPKFELISAFMHVISTARTKKTESKMNALESPQHFSHYKYMGIFPETQGQLTP